MGKFSGYLICSDIDGTFSVNTVPVQKNIDAVKYFTKNGGRFTMATGRTAAYLKKCSFFECINAPACICNGSAVYDYETESILRIRHQKFTLKEFLDATSDFKEKISGLYVYFTPDTVQAENMAGKEFEEKYLPQNPIKIVCVTDVVTDADLFKKHCTNHPLFKDTFISKSWDTGVEFNPGDGTKGDAVEFIKKFLPDVHTSVAIGDYENDVPMLKKADIAVGVENGLDCVKEFADYIVKNANDGAVADFIEKLERRIDEKR